MIGDCVRLSGARWCGASNLVPAKTSFSQLFGVPKDPNWTPTFRSFPRRLRRSHYCSGNPRCHLSDLIARVKLPAFRPHSLENNMWILPVLGYVGVILGFGFLTLAIGTLVLRICEE
jgi:hypothetical protein